MKKQPTSMIRLAKDAVFVEGAFCGAIYNFGNGKVFHINKESCVLLRLFLDKSFSPNQEQRDYYNLLVENGLLDPDFLGKPFHLRREKRNTFKTVWLELTMGCNCKCIHCYEGNEHACSRDTLSLEDWFRVIEQIHRFGASRIILIGGEPCVYPHLVEIMRHIHSYGIEMTLFTNATLINDAIFEAIVKNNVKVKVSIYGSTSETHDAITKLPGSFEKMLFNIKRLKKADVEVVPSVIIMKNNQNEVTAIHKFVTELGMNWNGYDVVRRIGCGSAPQYAPTNETLNRRYRTKPAFYASKPFFQETFFHNNCWNGKIVISENGDVFPCVFARTEKCGNVKNNTIEEIVQNQLVAYWDYDYSKVDKCKDCEYRFACKDCRPVAMAETGLLGSHTDQCKYDPYTGDWRD